MTDFTVLHAPLHGPDVTRAEIRRGLRLEPTFFCPTEAYNRIPFLRLQGAYRMALASSKTDPRRGPKDNPILTRRGVTKRVEAWQRQGCHASTPRSIAPERWNSCSVARVRGVATPVAVFEAHPNAAIQGKGLQVDRVRKYATQMRVLEAEIRAAQAKGYLIVVVGDFNHHEVPSGQRVPHWAPQLMFARLRLNYQARGLDWVAWDRRLRRTHIDVIPESVNGQDHPWILTGFAERG